jgi:hypothetical protein
MAVIVHSAYTDEEYADWRRKWLACGEAGGVLISNVPNSLPAILTGEN